MNVDDREMLPARLPDGQIVAKQRQRIHREGSEHFAVHVLCIHEQLVSLQRRGGLPKRNPHRWTSTASGHIDMQDYSPGAAGAVTIDIAARAAVRELGEELQAIGVAREFEPTERPRFIGAGAASSRSSDGLEICNAYAFVFVVELQYPLPNIVRHDSIERPSEVEALQAFDVISVDRAIRDAALLDERYSFADNFPTVWAIARDTLLSNRLGLSG